MDMERDESIKLLDEESVNEVKNSKTIYGVVDCAKLNIREQPNMSADVICIVARDAELLIGEEESNDEWLYVCTNTGIEGYCMRKFVAVKQ